MNIEYCPKCGGRVWSVSIGWLCEKCRGFIDMQGGFYEHNDSPFMPRQTNADRLRSMTDEELAECLVQNAKCTGCNAENCDKEFCVNFMKDWLKQPWEEEHDYVKAVPILRV